MADFINVTTTNRFHVKDRKAFGAFMDNVQKTNMYGDEWRVTDFEDGTFVIESIWYNYVLDETGFFNGLKEHVASDDVIIFKVVGYMKLRDINANAFIITSNSVSDIWLDDAAVDKAREMLGNPNYETQIGN